MRRTFWALAPSLAVAALLLAGCGSGNNSKNANRPEASASAPVASASATRAPATSVAATSAPAASGSPAAASGAPAATAGGSPAPASAPAASQPTAASTGVAGQIEQKLLGALLSGSDLPAGLTVLNARQPLNNQQYAQSATTSNNVASFQQAQSAAGRVTGVVLNVSAPDASNPSGATNEITNLLIMLSDYSSPAQASAALPGLLDSVTPKSKNPQAYSVGKADVQLGAIGDQTTAVAYKISAILGGQPDQIVWVVGVRRGAVDELYVLSGVGGAPTQQQVTDLVTRQDASVAKAGL